MAKQKGFDDPLEGIDPVMEQAFSVNDLEDDHLFNEDDLTEHVYQERQSQPSDAPHVQQVQFPELTREDSGKKVETDVFSNIPVSLSVELGRSQISLKEVFELTEGSIIELERLVGEPLDLVVNGQVIAQGEVVAIDNNYGLRITNIVARAH